MQITPSHELYRERLWPAVWVLVSIALVIPASLLVFLPISIEVGIVTAVVLYGGFVTTLLVTAPVISVSRSRIAAGRATLPVGFAGAPEVFRGTEATLERGQRLDARAWLVIRGWVSPIVKIPVTDPADPTPYWIVSSRRPDELAAAIAAARSGETGTGG